VGLSFNLSSRAIVSHGKTKKDGFGRLAADLPHDAIVRQRGLTMVRGEN